MIKKIEKIGYVVLEFFDSDIQEIKENCDGFIKEYDCFYAIIGNKKKGGLVLDKAHLTLFFGLDNNKFDKKYLTNIKVEYVELMELDLFFIKEFNCNALVLKVKDNNSKLKKVNNNLSKLNILKNKINKFEFIPHILD